MASTPNVELEAAKFLHKLIQESKDEPTKLATKLYVILQHMRSSGKENSMPYQVISRAMETVIKQHNLDIEALMSSRLPVAAGAQMGDTSSQLAGPSQRAGVVANPKASLSTNEVARPEAHASTMGHVGPSCGGQDMYRGNASLSNGPTKVHGATAGASGSYPSLDAGISNAMHFSSSSYENHGFVTKIKNEKIPETYSAAPSFDISASKSTAGKAVDHEGGNNTIANKAIEGGVGNNATETSILKTVGPRDTGKSPASSAPFKEQQLRQLRAQCLVFLAFRNGLMPKKLHLEIALGNIHPKDDGQRREQFVHDPSNVPEVPRPFGRAEIVRETDRLPPGLSTVGNLVETNTPRVAENSNVVEDRSGPSTAQFENVEGKHHFIRKKPDGEEMTESESSASRGLHPDSNIKGFPTSYNRNDLKSGQQNGTSNHASLSIGSGQSRKDNVQNQSPTECNFQMSRFAESNLPSFQSREQWTPISGMDGQNPSAMLAKDTDIMMNSISLVQESEPEDEDNSISTDRHPSPKYTTVDKWILDRQKRKVLTEQKRAQKQQKTENKIAACFDKLKKSVSSSEDIFAKTKSVIELKKLQLLELQRRLRSDILNDFFKPIASDMERLKSIKKHRIGRKSKQLERYEQRMKEERQKRFRERQKEFFSEIEVHRERLEDTFKMRRERWKGLNRFVREFHKRKERIHREKIDRIQREKINLLKINDVEGYLRMVQDAKSDRVKQLLKETEKYLSKLGAKLQEAKVITRRFETEMDESRSTGFIEKSDVAADDEDDTDQAKHYLESNEKYYMMAHSIKENITEQPACLVGGKLREYQMNGLRWLVSLYNNHLNGILADEMGLGKTVQVISLICYLMETKNDRGPFLVVVPSSVLSGWELEINFWAPSIHKIVYSGPPEERRRLFKEQIVHQKFNVLLTTYEYLMNKHDRPKLSKVHWHYIIIDEGHRIKNASCKLNADLKHYRSNHRLLLTGTPLQNNLEELWALLNFLLPNIFNSSEDFSQWFNKPFESNGDNSPDEALLSEEENLLIINRLHQVLRPFVLRRLKHKVENELPEKIERLIRCEASAYQKLLMKRVEENLGAIGTSKARSVHNSVMELRNICNHPYLSQLHVEEVHDLIPKHYLPNIVRLCGKLEMLDRLLPKLKATDHRVLLFSTMTRLLDVMEDYLYWKQYKYLRLDGHTSGSDRGTLIDLFNQPGSPYFIFLLSIRAGGVGVNLQAADTVIIFDTDWNPQVDLQAQARAHRIGQKKDVLVLRLETVQTVEEQVRASAEHKLGVANQSITAGFFDNNTSAEDRREYLESLLRECKKEEAAPVLDDDALNDLIARSESEIDVFESVDKRRQEEEMAAWKQLDTEGLGSSSLPPRLLTEDDLKAFYEAMKITEAPHPTVPSMTGVKRKGEYLGGLDTQQYGRGKRAREVRSYEEQWTEEEFERMCQVDSSGSPNNKDPNAEMKLPTVTSGSGVLTGVKVEPPILPSPTQPTFNSTGQQNKEKIPPIKRGRGRPKRTVIPMDIPASVATPAPSGVIKMESGSMVENAIGNSVLQRPDSVPSSTPGKSISGNTNQVDVLATPSSHPAPLPSPGPASQPTRLSTSGQGRGRGRKGPTGEAPRRRGKKQNLVLQDVPVTSLPPESKPETGKQETVSETRPVSCSAATQDEASKEPNAVSPVPVLYSVVEKVNVETKRESDVSCSVVPVPESIPAVSTDKEDHTSRTAPSSELPPSLPSVIPVSQTFLPQSEPRQGKGRGRKPQTGGEAPRRRGKRQDPATPVVLSVSADQDPKSVEAPQKRSRVSAGRRVSARSKQDNELKMQMPSIQLNTAQTTSDPAIEQIHNVGQENRIQEKSNANADVSRGCANPAVEDTGTELTALIKDIPEESCLSEDKKDAPPKSEYIDSLAVPVSNSNEVSKGPSLCSETGSATFSGITVQSGDLKIGEHGSQPRKTGREKGQQQPKNTIQSHTSLTLANPSSGNICDADVKNYTTATKEVKTHIVSSETACEDTHGNESRGSPDLPSSSKTCTEDVKDRLLEVPATSSSTLESEVSLDKVAGEMCGSAARKDDGENKVLPDKVTGEMHETQSWKGNGETVQADNATKKFSECQSRNEDCTKGAQMQVLAPSIPASDLALAQSDRGKPKQEQETDPDPEGFLFPNLPTTAAPAITKLALNNSEDQEERGCKSVYPASCDVYGSKLDIPTSTPTCCGDVKGHAADDKSIPTLRSSDVNDSNSNEICEGQVDKEAVVKEELMQNASVDTSDPIAPTGPASDLVIRADSCSFKLEDHEKEDLAPTEVLFSSLPASATLCPGLTTGLLDTDETCSRHLKDQTLHVGTTSTLKSAAISDCFTDGTPAGQASKHVVEKQGQVQNSSLDETSALSAPVSIALDSALCKVDSHSVKLEDQEKAENAQTGVPFQNSPTIVDAPLNRKIALNSSGDLSGQEVRIYKLSTDARDICESNSDLPASVDTCSQNIKDQTLDDKSASTARSSDVVDGATDETCKALDGKGDMTKGGLMPNNLVDQDSQLAPRPPASDLSSVPADSYSREVEAQGMEDPVLSEAIVSSFPTSETAPAKEDRTDLESKDSASDISGLNTDLLAPTETSCGDVRDSCLDKSLQSGPRSAGIVDGTIDEVGGGQSGKCDVENEGQEQNPSANITSALLAPSAHASDLSFDQADNRSGNLEGQGKEESAPVEVLVSDLLSVDATPSIDNTLSFSGDLSEKEDRVDHESEEPAPCAVSGSDLDLPASTETFCGAIKEQPLDDLPASTRRFSAVVSSAPVELCEGQANKGEMGKEGQMQNASDSALLAPFAHVSESVSSPADSHSGKLEELEREDPCQIEVLVRSAPSMETAPPSFEIALNHSEDPYLGEDRMGLKHEKSVPCDVPDSRLDSAASVESYSEDIKDQSLNETSASICRSAAIFYNSTDETCKGVSGKEDKIGQESESSAPRDNVELGPKLSVSSQACTDVIKGQTVDDGHASASTGGLARLGHGTGDESCKGHVADEDGEKVGEVESSVAKNFGQLVPPPPTTDLLMSGDQSDLKELVEEQDNPVMGEQNCSTEEDKISAMDDAGLAMNMGLQKDFLSSSPTLRPEASSLASPVTETENLSVEELGGKENTLGSPVTEPQNVSAEEVEGKEDTLGSPVTERENVSAEEVEGKGSVAELENVSAEEVQRKGSTLGSYVTEPENVSAEVVEGKGSVAEPANVSAEEVERKENNLGSPVTEPENVCAEEVERKQSTLGSPVTEPEPVFSAEEIE